jgi:prepilin-type N-terminal cleavage/methylation domain-containing protein
MNRIDLRHRSRGFSFIEVLISAAIFSLVFGGLYVAIKHSVNLIRISKASSGALALANERLEYIRSLSYNSVGTLGGIPDGPIPQNATTSLNGTMYHERVLIQYIDSPDDGEGAADDNGILADYKQVKVEYSWAGEGSTSTLALLTNIVPPGIESTVGGGTLRVNVFDATIQPVSGAEVHLYNDTTTSTIDTTRFTNASGEVLFAGAPAAASYQITVTGTDLSTDQTYSASSSNPNPVTPHVAVLEGQVSTMNFQIDELGDLLVRTVGPGSDGEFVDTFDDLSDLASSNNVESNGNELILAGGAGSYAAGGDAISVATTPGGFASWDVAVFLINVPVGTTALVHLYEVVGSSTYALIPDGDLPGNSVGFTSSPIDLSGVNVGSYPSLALGIEFTTLDPTFTPALDNWGLYYTITEPAIAGTPFTLTGNKIIGTTASATPIYKYSESHLTDGSGETALNNLEWDFYTVSLNTAAYDIAEACKNIPYVLDPGANETLKLTLVAGTAYTLRVSVVDADGDPVIGADVDLTRPGFSDSGVTSSCGQMFFNSGLGAFDDYQIDVSASGYVTEIISDIVIDDDETLVVTLST